MEGEKLFVLNSTEYVSPNTDGLNESGKHFVGEKCPIGPRIEEKILQIFSERQDLYKKKGWISEDEGASESLQSELEKEGVQEIAIDDKKDSIVEESIVPNLKNGKAKNMKKNITFNLISLIDDRERKNSPKGHLQEEEIRPKRPKTALSIKFKDNLESLLGLSQKKKSRNGENQESEAVASNTLSKYIIGQPASHRRVVFKRRKAKLIYRNFEDLSLRGLLFRQRLDRFARNLRSHSGRNDRSKLSLEKLRVINDKSAYASELSAQSSHSRTNKPGKTWMRAGLVTLAYL